MLIICIIFIFLSIINYSKLLYLLINVIIIIIKLVIAAAKLTNADEFIEKFPEKYNIHIGENGYKLSVSQRQRISISRTFLKNAPIILLDEVTASLNIENETLIQSVIAHLIKNKTVLVIAHRMCTIAGADKIIVLSNRTVVE